MRTVVDILLFDWGTEESRKAVREKKLSLGGSFQEEMERR